MGQVETRCPVTALQPGDAVDLEHDEHFAAALARLLTSDPAAAATAEKAAKWMYGVVMKVDHNEDDTVTVAFDQVCITVQFPVDYEAWRCH